MVYGVDKQGGTTMPPLSDNYYRKWVSVEKTIGTRIWRPKISPTEGLSIANFLAWRAKMGR